MAIQPSPQTLYHNPTGRHFAASMAEAAVKKRDLLMHLGIVTMRIEFLLHLAASSPQIVPLDLKLNFIPQLNL